MPHKADRSFFDEKRGWSKRKDRILAYYLEPYLAKVARRGRPILVVDGFAGPGKFADGQVGSPLIICAKAQDRVESGAGVSVLCIESDPELYQLLRANLSAFPFAEAAAGTFLDHIPKIRGLARSHTIFLYVDPWAVEGLDWNALDSVFDEVMQARGSVELLLNFNAPVFVRRALAVLKCEVPAIDPEVEDSEESAGASLASPSSARMNQLCDEAKRLVQDMEESLTRLSQRIHGQNET